MGIVNKSAGPIVFYRLSWFVCCLCRNTTDLEGQTEQKDAGLSKLLRFSFRHVCHTAHTTQSLLILVFTCTSKVKDLHAGSRSDKIWTYKIRAHAAIGFPYPIAAFPAIWRTYNLESINISELPYIGIHQSRGEVEVCSVWNPNDFINKLPRKLK